MTAQLMATKNDWDLGMPYWDGIWDYNRPDAWWGPDAYEEGLKLYCDLETRQTTALLEDTDGYEWCAYTWDEDGHGHMASNTDEMWWVLDDALWGPLYWWNYWPDGREMTEKENRVARGWAEDDLLYDMEMRMVDLMLERELGRCE